MTSKILSATLIATIGVILLAWAPSAAYGGFGPTIGMAFTDTGFGCTLPDGDGGFFGTADPDNIVVEANSANNNIKLTCHASGVPNSQGHAVVLKGFGCSIFTDDQGVFTTDTRATISADGEASMTCKFKAA